MLQGRFFFALSPHCVDAVARRTGNLIEIRDAKDVLLASVAVDQLHASASLGKLRRRLDLPDGSSFDTEDGDGMDAVLDGESLLHRLERSWRGVAAAVLFSGIATAAFAFYGVPAMAGWLARHTSPAIARYTTTQTLFAMDKLGMRPSKLPPGARAHYRALLRTLAAKAPRGAEGYRLTFRDAPAIGPNAFALPDGTIVMTDQIVPLVKRDEELEGVFAHEISHVDHAHGLQRVYQASLVPAAIAFITGDASQVGQVAAVLPGVLLQSAYSRAFEQQADDDAVTLMRRIGKSGAPLADLLERMEAKICGRSGGCGPSWLGSHPATAARAARLRAQAI